MTVRVTRVFLDVVGCYSDVVIKSLQGVVSGSSNLVATITEPPHFEYIAGVLPAVSSIEIAEPVFITDKLLGNIGASSKLRLFLQPTFSLTYESNHVSTGLLRLIEQFKNKPTLSSLISSYLVGVQRLEDALYSLLAERNIWTATGTQLDGLGLIVGAERGGDNDDEFRERILVTVLINASHGSPEDIIGIFYSLTNAEIELSEFQPAAISVYLKTPLDSADNFAQARRFAGYLERSKPAGVSAKLYFQGSASEVVKAFDTVDRGFDAGRFAGVAI